MKAVVSEISGNVLADIGTDHGYIAIEALLSGRVARAILCDLNKGPLARAVKNIDAKGLSHRAETRLGSGLMPLNPNEADCVCIAGMGGMLITEILQEGAHVLQSVERLVIQPQLDIHTVRKFVHSAGFKIANEHMLYEGRFYTILSCKPGQDSEYGIAEYLFGKILIERKDAVLKQYLEYRIAECVKICEAQDSGRQDRGRFCVLLNGKTHNRPLSWQNRPLSCHCREVLACL